jgi:hypothetical protein
MVQSPHTEFEEYGPVLSGDELAQTGAGILTTRILENVRQANGSLIAEIELAVLANASFNAIATTRADGERIALFIGIPDTLLTVIPSSLATPDAWPAVGNSAVEDGGPVPHDPTRSLFAAEAASAGLYFVVAHELGHILRGHLSFVASRFHQDMLPELGYGRNDRIPSAALRAMEIDADTMAAASFADNALLAIRGLSRLSPFDFLCARLFGLGVVFALLSQPDGGAKASELTHPRPHVRYIMATQRIRAPIAEAIPTVFTATVDPVRESYRELSRLFPRLWVAGVSEKAVIRTSELQELILTCQKLEPDFLAFANARVPRDGPTPKAT